MKNFDKFDLIVAGGGFAGAAAALAAAREGMHVMLFDQKNCLGGAAAGGLVNPFMKYWIDDPVTKERRVISEGIFREILQKLTEMSATPDDIHFNEEYLKLILMRMLLDAGVEILFHSYLVEANVDNTEVNSVTLVNKSGKQTYYADYFIDATGDGDLAFACGCPYKLGRDNDSLCQPMTLCFRVCNVDIEKFKQEIPQIQKLYKEYQAEGKIKNIRENILWFEVPIQGVLHFNSTRIIKKNPVNANELSEAEIEAREQVFELYMFLKKYAASFQNAEIISTAGEIGVRESRKIIGEYVLAKEDIMAYTKFEDSIAACSYNMDIHSPDGSGTSHFYFPDGAYYTIPYRCLTPKTTTNLITAGRCISSTHEAQSSYRIMPVCCCIGQAAGVAAAIAKKDGKNVKEIDISKLQKRLEECGAVVR